MRIPAAWNDLVGLKTTSGRLPLDGVVPLCERFDTIGPLAHSVEDCALLLAALDGSRPVDLTGASLSGLRLAVLETVALDDLRDRPAQGFADACDRLSRAGARIERLAAPEVAEAMGLAATLFTAEAYGIWRDTIERAPDRMFPASWNGSAPGRRPLRPIMLRAGGGFTPCGSSGTPGWPAMTRCWSPPRPSSRPRPTG